MTPSAQTSARMLFMGVDPGKTGAIVTLDDAGRIVDVAATPMVESVTGKPEYDLPEIKALLTRHIVEAAGRVQVTLETSGETSRYGTPRATSIHLAADHAHGDRREGHGAALDPGGEAAVARRGPPPHTE